MPYKIMIGPGSGDFDSAHESAAEALKMGLELIRQGQRRVQIVDNDGVSRSVPAFAHIVQTEADAGRRSLRS